jgi:hypothetical protein
MTRSPVRFEATFRSSFSPIRLTAASTCYLLTGRAHTEAHGSWDIAEFVFDAAAVFFTKTARSRWGLIGDEAFLAGAQSYVLTATPVAGGAQINDGNLSISKTGQKISGTSSW